MGLLDFVGDIVDPVGSFTVDAIGGGVDLISDAVGGGDSKKKPASNPSPNSAPPQVDYSDALLVMSNNSKDTAIAQINGQKFAMQQASLDREMQNAANLELGLANLDTKLQTSKLDYMQAMKAEQDRHLEKLAASAQQFQAITSMPSDSHPDLPPPPNFDVPHDPKKAFV